MLGAADAICDHRRDPALSPQRQDSRAWIHGPSLGTQNRNRASCPQGRGGEEGSGEGEMRGDMREVRG